MGKYFGTDGIRGVANTELSPELALRLGRIGGYVLTRSKNDSRPKVVIGRDTRVSGEMLEAALVAGLLSIGVDVLQLGVLPTPGVAYVTKALGADAGVMITASHNPLEDNGVKFFGGDGFKLSDQLEVEIETLLEMNQSSLSNHLLSQTININMDLVPRPSGAEIGSIQLVPEGSLSYLTHLKTTVEHRLSGLKIVLDCANGAASELAPQLLTELGANVIVLANQPNGLNINKGCGSTYPEHVQKAVLEHKADLGLSFDGDADRLIAVDELGDVVDGDQIMFVLAEHMRKKDRLKNNTVVSTVMSNLGFIQTLQNIGIEVKNCNVGDRYVMEQMIQGGYNLGGEQSGHIIMLDYATTGDGMLAAIQLLDVMKSESKPLSYLVSRMSKYPQLLVNVQVVDKHKVKENKRIKEAIRSVEDRMKGLGRVLVRPSGTESLVRVMIEGPDEKELAIFADIIVEAIKYEITYSLV